MCAKVAEREREGKHFTLVVVAEGAREQGKDYVTAGNAEKNREARLGGIGAVVAAEIQKRTGKETRVCVLGHLQRGGAPTSFDRLLCTRFGARAVQLIAEEQYGHMVALRPPDTVAVKISEAVGRLRAVPPNGDIVQSRPRLGHQLRGLVFRGSLRATWMPGKSAGALTFGRLSRLRGKHRGSYAWPVMCSHGHDPFSSFDWRRVYAKLPMCDNL